jgi:hypothetical protein
MGQAGQHTALLLEEQEMSAHTVILDCTLVQFAGLGLLLSTVPLDYMTVRLEEMGEAGIVVESGYVLEDGLVRRTAAWS